MVAVHDGADHGHGAHGVHRAAVPVGRLAGEEADEVSHDAPGRKDEDVHFGVTEDPEQVLEEDGVAIPRGASDEERRSEAAVHQQQNCTGGEDGHEQHVEDRCEPEAPHRQGHLEVAHPGRPQADHGGDVVDATGTSKGKGFAGNIKRHNFERHRKTHGGKGNTRRPGSIGSMYPQKVFKGKRMAGRMGHDQVTVKNLVVSYIDADNNLIGLKGAVPGPKKGLIVIDVAGGKA